MKTIGHLITGALLLALPLLLAAEAVGDPPLPSVETVLKRVVAAAEKESENDRAFEQRYRYTRTKMTEYRNSEGDLKKREEKKLTHDPATAPASSSGQPAAARTRSPKDTGQNEAVTDTHTNVRGKAFERKDFSLNDDLLGRFEFALTGREMVKGRSALLLEFKPADKPLPERNLKDRLINRAAGRIWVDESDYAVAKVDFYLTEKVSVLGGLVGAVWKFTYTFGRERTVDGLWFTRSVDWHMEGREVFLHRTVDYHEEKTGVQQAQ